jgi:hypothetical protein
MVTIGNCYRNGRTTTVKGEKNGFKREEEWLLKERIVTIKEPGFGKGRKKKGKENGNKRE